MGRPSGIVTFLFTDIEGSTRRWEAEPDSMRAALAVHDEVLRSTVEAADGWLFKHTGDGVCVAFTSPDAALDAAMSAQRVLELPVRMGMATGEAELRRDDYFGPALNRAARVMAAGHGGQVLVAESTAALVSDVGLLDLGERRLRDLSGAQRLFQATGPGLRLDFPPLRTLDSVPGNLPVQTTSFIGRDLDVAEIAELVREHRLVTLTGVGGVGKTRLALQVAAELVAEFPGGVWLVELAEVGDPAAVPAAVATELSLTPQAGVSLTESIAQSMGDRRSLVLLDNCEHVLDAAAELVEAMLAAGSTLKVLSTSREGLRVEGEHVLSVPSLDVRRGVDSAAVELFVERAQAVDNSFSISTAEDATAVAEICTRLDGIALAIELAAARMVAMNPADVRDRLGDRFRLLAGGRRGLERHQTLRHAVQWSYELLDEDERTVLNHCAVFAGGFDLEAAVNVVAAARFDEFQMLDLLESLVRKSLLTIDRGGADTRYTMLETVRQFGEEQLAAMGNAEDCRNQHALHFAQGAAANFETYASSEQAMAFQWYNAESSNLRAAFRWAADTGDLDTAAAIAGKVCIIGVFTQSFEPVGWCEEILQAATDQQHRLLKYLHAGASLCAFAGRPEDGVRYGEAGRALRAGPDFDRVTHELESTGLIIGYLFSGQPEQWIELAGKEIDNPHDDLALYATGLVWVLSSMGRYDEAISLADDTLRRVEATRNIGQLAYALSSYSKAFTVADPQKAIDAQRRAVRAAAEGQNRLFEAVFSRELAGLEAKHGDPLTALETFDDVIDAFHNTGDTGNLAATLGFLVVLFERIGQDIAAATLLGAATRHRAAMAMVTELGETSESLRRALGDHMHDENVEIGNAMDATQAVSYAHEQITHARQQITHSN